MREAQRRLKIVITSGPTREPIDPVRFLSNYSTGYMGAQLVSCALQRGHRVTVISGPSQEPLPNGARVVRVERADEMDRVLRRRARGADVVIMAAAVSDFRPRRVARAKLQLRATRTLVLEPTLDLIGRLPRRARQVVVGFALETEQVLPRASAKLKAKRLHLLLAQRAQGAGSPFGRRSVQEWVLERTGGGTPLGKRSKAQISRVLLDKVEALWYGQHSLGHEAAPLRRG